MKQFPILYKRATTGKIQQWVMVVDGNQFYSISGEHGGKQTTTLPTMAESKNIGKANESSASDQAEKEAQAKWDHKLAHGYTADLNGTDNTGYQEPMLAKQFEDYRDKIGYPVQVDAKLNGMRCNARADGSVKSRKGKPINTIPHIVAALAPLFVKHPGLFLDGELYNPVHKNNLNRLIELTSVAYKPKDVTVELLQASREMVQFHLYDGFGFGEYFGQVTQHTPFKLRRVRLKQLIEELKSDCLFVLAGTECLDEKAVRDLLRKSKQEKSEGIIVRWGDCPYEFKRSKYLLKLKNFLEEDFEIVDVQQGSADWTGCAKRIVLKLHLPVIGRDGKEQSTFASNIEGDREWLRRLYNDRANVIGYTAEVTYQEKSEFGIPLIPYVTAIKNYE